MSDYNEAIRIDPNLALAYYNRGLAYTSQGNLDKAISDFNEVIRIDRPSVSSSTAKLRRSTRKAAHRFSSSGYSKAREVFRWSRIYHFAMGISRLFPVLGLLLCAIAVLRG
jgi:tetratricopeptide (TPR) repeat protein